MMRDIGVNLPLVLLGFVLELEKQKTANSHSNPHNFEKSIALHHFLLLRYKNLIYISR